MKIKNIGLLGFGRFGSMAYHHLARRIQVRVYDVDETRLEGVPDAASFEEAVQSDLLLLSIPISGLAGLCERLKPHLRAGQVVVDTCSVKSKPVEWMLQHLPEEVEILGTHPLFGPDSGKEGIGGLKIVVCPARIQRERYDEICAFLRGLELVVVEATPEEHDRQIALSQAVFHLIAQAMGRLGWGVKPISTPGPDSFYRLVKTVQRDTEQLFRDMERENPFAAECRREFIDEILRIDRELRSQREEE